MLDNNMKNTLKIDYPIFNARINVAEIDFSTRPKIIQEIFEERYNVIKDFIDTKLRGDKTITKRGFINEGHVLGLETKVLELDISYQLPELGAMYRCLEKDCNKYFKNPCLTQTGERLFLDYDDNKQLYIMNIRQKYWDPHN